MSKLSKFGLATALGLLMGLSLFTSSVFAQSVNRSDISTATHTVAIAANAQQMASIAVQTSGIQKVHSQQTTQPAIYNESKVWRPRYHCYWTGGWGRHGWHRWRVCRRW